MKQEETRMDVRLRMGVSRRARGFAQSDQILSLTSELPPPNILPTRSFPLYQRQALNWCFILCLFSLLGTGRIPLLHSQKAEQNRELCPEGAEAVPVQTLGMSWV